MGHVEHTTRDMECDGADPMEIRRSEVTAAIAPVYADIQAEALRDAALTWQLGGWAGILPLPDDALPVLSMANHGAAWLRAHADELDGGGKMVIQYSLALWARGDEEARAGSRVDAHNGSTVYAHNGAVVHAHHGSNVDAHNGSTVYTRNGSNVNAYASSRVYASAGSNVVARPAANITHINTQGQDTTP